MVYPRVTGSPGQQFWQGRVGSRVSVSDPVFDLVLNFNIHVFGVISTEYHHLGIIYLPNFMPSSLKALLCNKSSVGWWRSPAVEHWSLADVLSLSCARLVADG